MDEVKDNPLGYAPIGKLIFKYATPSILSLLVSATYNIVDQVFIGNIVGMYANGATNVSFPLVTFCAAMALMIGAGSAANFNINMGAGKKDEAARYAGTGLTMIVVFGVFMAAVSLIFTRSLMRAFGATYNMLDLAVRYTRITAIGFPFQMFSHACSNLIRADGRPTYSMISTVAGSVTDIVLNYVFMVPMQMGFDGAAYSTIIGQFVSSMMVLGYMLRFRSVKLTAPLLIPRLKYFKGIIKLGLSNFINHFVMTLVQITMNRVFKQYGAVSVYGSDIPLAVAGVIAKINSIFIAFTVGTAQGCQPIHGFCTGAKKYDRVKATYKRALVFVLAFSVLAFCGFQLFPREIVSIFGRGRDLPPGMVETYFRFAEQYMRIFMMMACIFGIQPLTVNFFAATGKAKQGIFLSLARQGLFLLPLLLILPMFMGLNGALISGPIADFLAVVFCITLMVREFRRLTALQNESAK